MRGSEIVSVLLPPDALDGSLGSVLASLAFRPRAPTRGRLFLLTGLVIRWPLWVRRILGRVYCIGGSKADKFYFIPPARILTLVFFHLVHSGAAISGTIWFILFAAQSTRQFLKKEHVSSASYA